MSHIDIVRKHTLSHEQARKAAEDVAAHLNERFNLNYRWEGDSLHFKRSGVDGRLDITELEVRVRAQLGLLMLAMRPLLEEQINRYLDKIFETRN